MSVRQFIFWVLFLLSTVAASVLILYLVGAISFGGCPCLP